MSDRGVKEILRGVEFGTIRQDDGNRGIHDFSDEESRAEISALIRQQEEEVKAKKAQLKEAKMAQAKGVAEAEGESTQEEELLAILDKIDAFPWHGPIAERMAKAKVLLEKPSAISPPPASDGAPLEGLSVRRSVGDVPAMRKRKRSDDADEDEIKAHEEHDQLSRTRLILPPEKIRVARSAIVEAIVDSLESATAAPDKDCSNAACNGRHINEDCNLQPLCDGCGRIGHFPKECDAVCQTCGWKGHSSTRCRATMSIKAKRIRRMGTPAPLIRPSGEERKEPQPLRERLCTEVYRRIDGGKGTSLMGSIAGRDASNHDIASRSVLTNNASSGKNDALGGQVAAPQRTTQKPLVDTRTPMSGPPLATFGPRSSHTGLIARDHRPSAWSPPRGRQMPYNHGTGRRHRK